MALTESLTAQAIRELNATDCAACGNNKNRAQSFCRRCYFSLSPAERISLYNTFSEGYASIYDELKTKLRAEQA